MLVWQLNAHNTMAVLKKTTYGQAFFLASLLHLGCFIVIAIFVSLRSHEPIYEQIIEVEILTEKNENLLAHSKQFMTETGEINIENKSGNEVSKSRVGEKSAISSSSSSSSSVLVGEGEMSNLGTGRGMNTSDSLPNMKNQELSGGGNSGERIPQAPRISLQAYLARLENLKEYPYMARKRSQEGTVLLRVVFSASGNVIHAGVLQSSGSENLDKAALQLIHRGGTLEHDAGKNIEIEIPITYSLKG